LVKQLGATDVTLVPGISVALPHVRGSYSMTRPVSGNLKASSKSILKNPLRARSRTGSPRWFLRWRATGQAGARSARVPIAVSVTRPGKAAPRRCRLPAQVSGLPSRSRPVRLELVRINFARRRGAIGFVRKCDRNGCVKTLTDTIRRVSLVVVMACGGEAGLTGRIRQGARGGT
jgi:hypothetical protein